MIRWVLTSIFIMIICSISLQAKSGALYAKGEPQAITDGSHYFARPSWSPDGRMLAFTGENQHGLWVVDADGSNLRQLTAETGVGFGFQWSSDSKEILCRASKSVKRRRYHAIKIFNVDGHSRRISGYRSFMPGLPRWTEADEKIYLYSDQNGLEVFDSDSMELKSKIFPQNLSQPLFYLSANGLNVLNPHAVSAVSFKLPEGTILNEVLSPMADKIAFEVVGKGMFVVNIDGTNPVDLGVGYRPAWSPDGKRLVYMLTKDDGHAYISADIYSINIDGTAKTQITNTNDLLEMNPDCSPDADKIVFNTMNTGTIYIIELETK